MDSHCGMWYEGSLVKRSLKKDCKYFKKDGKLVSCAIRWTKRKMRRCDTCKLQHQF